MWLKTISKRIKSWVFKHIKEHMLFHYIFGLWAGLLGALFNNRRLGIIIATLIVATGKELFDYWDYGLFSWKDVLSTSMGGGHY